MLGYFICAVVGGAVGCMLGMILMCCLIMAGREDDKYEESQQRK